MLLGVAGSLKSALETNLSEGSVSVFVASLMGRKRSAGRDELRAAMRDYVKVIRQTLYALFNVARASQGLPPIKPEPDIQLPKPSDFAQENIRKRQIIAIQKKIKRERKLSATNLWEIVQLRERHHSTWSKIAERMGTSERAVRKGYQRAKAALVTRKEPSEL